MNNIKLIMNQNKKTNGWILCPSKTFPGKFYYFNVLNGETAWSLSEAETKALRKDTTINKITDKSHTYPEPDSPPIEISPSTVSSITNMIKKPDFIVPPQNIYPNIVQNQSQMFGQAIFPNYVTNMEQYMPNIVWVPTQLPTPMYTANTPDVKRKLNQCTQTEIYCFVQPSSMPLSERFAKYKKDMAERLNFKYDTLTPMNKRNVMANQLFCEERTCSNSPVLKRTRTQSENDKNDNISRPVSEESLLKYDQLTKDKDCGMLNKLDRSDLRFLLTAKRRKSLDLGTLQGKKIKISETTSKTSNIVQKHVTFNLEDQEYDSLEGNDSNEIHSEETLKSNEWNLNKDLCYFIADAQTLFDEFELIEQYILSDDKRRLLLPRLVLSAIEASCAGDCRGRQRVMVARQVARKLANHLPYIVSLPEDKNLGPTIVECCLAIMEEKYQVILLTNDLELQVDAVSMKIKCLTPRKIKESTGTEKAKTSVDIRIHVRNDTKDKNANNLFLQPANDIKPFIFDNKTFSVDTFKKRLFEKQDGITKTITNTHQNKIANINASLLVNKNINFRRTFTNNNEDNILNDENASTSDIGIDMENLFIKDNKKTQKETVNKKPQSLVDTEKPIQNDIFEKRTQMFEIQKTKAKSLESQGFNKKEKVYSMEDCLMKYCIKSEVVEERVTERMEEFICTFTQVLEDALTSLVLKKTPITDTLSPPWVLYELIKVVKKMYGSCTEVKMVGERLTTLLVKESNKIGKLRTTMKPADFMNIFGCGSLLIQVLRIILPKYEELSTAEDALEELLRKMESPSEDCEAPVFQTPIFSRSDVEALGNTRHNFVKKSSEIIDYLKRHFVAWESYKPTDDNVYEECEQHHKNETGDVRIVRTFGRNLNLLKLDRTKSLTLKKPINATSASYGNTDHEGVPNALNIATLKSCKNQERANIEEITMNAEDKDIEMFKKKFGIDTLPRPIFLSTKNSYFESSQKTTKAVDLLNGNTSEKQKNENTSKHAGAFNITLKDKVNTNENYTFQSLDRNMAPFDLNKPQYDDTLSQETIPLIVKNITTTDSFDGQTKNHGTDLDALDYSGINDSISLETLILSNEIKNDDMSIDENLSFVYEIKTKTQTSNESKKYENEQNVLNNYKIYEYSNLNNDSTNDSGFENESVHAHSLVKTFLTELSGSFKDIYNFIDNSIIEVRNNLQEDKKRILHNKASQTRVLIAEIIEKLKSIIQRESNEGTKLKALLVNAGVHASKDKRITRYKQVVTKCLEQARTLENALKVMLSVTAGDLRDCASDSVHTDIRYFNIFE